MEKITVKSIINTPIEKVWEVYNNPNDITQWCTASPDWHTPRATNDLRVGGTFTTRMEARDGSVGFDLVGTYTEVVPHERIAYTMGDGRSVEVAFTPEGEGTKVTTTFDPENQNPPEMQRAGWQAILDNFKTYVEANVESHA